MTEARLDIYNEASGKLQFTSDSSTLVLRASGTWNFTAAVSGATSTGQPAAALTLPARTIGRLAVRPVTPDFNLCLDYVVRIGGNMEYHFTGIGGGLGTQMVEYWVYDLPDLSNAPGPGQIRFEIYGNDGVGGTPGTLRWQLYQKPMRIVSVLQQAITTVDPYIQSVVEPSGKKYAVVLGDNAGYVTYQEIATPDGQPTRYRGFYRKDTMRQVGSPQRVEVGILQTDRGGAFYTAVNLPPDKFSGPRNVLVLDVTGH